MSRRGENGTKAPKRERAQILHLPVFKNLSGWLFAQHLGVAFVRCDLRFLDPRWGKIRHSYIYADIQHTHTHIYINVCINIWLHIYTHYALKIPHTYIYIYTYLVSIEFFSNLSFHLFQNDTHGHRGGSISSGLGCRIRCVTGGLWFHVKHGMVEVGMGRQDGWRCLRNCFGGEEHVFCLNKCSPVFLQQIMGCRGKWVLICKKWSNQQGLDWICLEMKFKIT